MREPRTCERCQGNGEIVTDWERYRHPHEGDVGDEAVAECPDCGGEGIIDETTDCCPMHSFSGSCENGECRSATRPIINLEKKMAAKRRSFRILEMITVAFYIAVSIICGITLDNHFKREALVQQEQVAWH